MPKSIPIAGEDIFAGGKVQKESPEPSFHLLLSCFVVYFFQIPHRIPAQLRENAREIERKMRKFSVEIKRNLFEIYLKTQGELAGSMERPVGLAALLRVRGMWFSLFFLFFSRFLLEILFLFVCREHKYLIILLKFILFQPVF